MKVNEFVTTTELLATKSASAILKVMIQKAANDLDVPTSSITVNFAKEGDKWCWSASKGGVTYSAETPVRALMELVAEEK